MDILTQVTTAVLAVLSLLLSNQALSIPRLRKELRADLKLEKRVCA